MTTESQEFAKQLEALAAAREEALRAGNSDAAQRCVTEQKALQNANPRLMAALAASESERVTWLIADIKQRWEAAAAAGNHAEAVSLENEQAALERSLIRVKIQEVAEASERRRRQAVEAAKATLAQMDRNAAAIAELNGRIASFETAAAAVAEAYASMAQALAKCRATRVNLASFDDTAQQEAYDDALGSKRYGSGGPRVVELSLEATNLAKVIDPIAYGLRGLIG